ncbi:MULTISPECIES: MoaD/ThiS family protein [unclassified Arcicella]|uniref:MoaD/ThiS family protein n=1 Tax=unclassified Arcicella TaxID=2644986 RepID=UPI00285B53F3|nr:MULTISPECIES: MoaD/ThiS family protein [unclassified Arcicella]MDR6561383.1 molybdopterin synthase sulfur carrier subunit [Arcicella sp. BE51]MDR6811267.1 molybdopterin synthase sulfur carrier subunit [Arcicella sp. BE140]MDR6822617.1 molybdopterin synthase sulfur carrier subunit [Arcicella sp. BE139]
MKYSINLFGITKEIIGSTLIEIEMEESVKVAQLLEKLKDDYPKLRAIKSLLVAVNSEYAEQDLALNFRDEIALIPPVSGG